MAGGPAERPGGGPGPIGGDSLPGRRRDSAGPLCWPPLTLPKRGDDACRCALCVHGMCISSLFSLCVGCPWLPPIVVPVVNFTKRKKKKEEEREREGKKKKKTIRGSDRLHFFLKLDALERRKERIG